jgi:ethanolamine utilization protein EutA
MPSHTHGHDEAHSHDGAHHHGEGHGHDEGHTHDEIPVGSDTLTSVGVDIGTSTSHLMFSQLQIGYRSLHSRRPEVLARKVVHRSPVMLTPFGDNWQIDADAIGALVDETFQAAKLSPDEVDTGAVIITGEAARKENAWQIAELFSQQVGRFVCATAGPRLETIMAAHGSGAVARAQEDCLAILNIDMGGGTTKISVIEGGRIGGTTALNIGARLVAIDGSGKLVRVEKAGRQFLDDVGCGAGIGDAIDDETLQLLAARMAEVLFDALSGVHPPWRDLFILPGFGPLPALDGIVFSGGVSEYIYGREKTAFGDLGPRLAAEVRKQADRHGHAIFDAGEGIRATVIGASQYSVQLSGETIFIPPATGLPMHNLRILVVEAGWEPPIADRAAEEVRKAVAQQDQEVMGTPFALVVSTPPFAGYGGAMELGQGLRTALLEMAPEERPHALVFEQNIAQVVGEILSPDISLPCIDEVSLSELDFIDVGARLPGENYVPIVVKSLVFDC